MNKPCEHCVKADKRRQDYFKCDTPCNLAKQCKENDKKLLENFTRLFYAVELTFPREPEEGKDESCQKEDTT